MLCASGLVSVVWSAGFRRKKQTRQLSGCWSDGVGTAGDLTGVWELGSPGGAGSSALGHRVSGGKRRVRRLPQLAQVKWSLQGVRRGLDKIDGLGRGGDGGQGGLQVYRKMLDTVGEVPTLRSWRDI